jgi:hypothetical protein
MSEEIAKDSTFILEYWPFGLAALGESKEFVEQLASLPTRFTFLMSSAVVWCQSTVGL